MKSYEEMVKDYRKRKKDTVVDTIAAGVTCVDQLATETGVMENVGEMAGLAEGVCNAAPFVMIAASEGAKVIARRKPVITGVKDGALRMVKSGAAMGVGAVVAGATTAWAAIPAAMGTRFLFDKHKSKMLTGVRIQSRTKRLQELSQHIHHEEKEQAEQAISCPDAIPVD